MAHVDAHSDRRLPRVDRGDLTDLDAEDLHVVTDVQAGGICELDREVRASGVPDGAASDDGERHQQQDDDDPRDTLSEE
jgi:hypothetical protein